ncbi:MAG: hypothetical protein SFV81_06210 [Pirellulaceae bacterium]|nr:hypothetical protein [Pirellulaceae bacterium]
MLLEPVKQYAKRCVVQYAFGTNLSAKDFKLHRQQELLEVNDLRANQSDDCAHVEVTTGLALVKLDMPTLLDKRFVSSRVKLQDVRIQLTSLSVQKPITSVAKPWQKSLEEVLVAFEWDSLRDDCEALLKSETVLRDFEERMRAWLLRSQQIMFHGDQLTRTIQGFSNPLRHQSEIRNHLSQMEQLQAEQHNLQQQFSGVNKILQSQLSDIRSMGERDLGSIRERSDSKLKSLQVLTAEQLVSEWAQQLTARQLQLSQSIATLLQASTRTNPYDVNVRSPLAKAPLLSLTGVAAEGFLCEAGKEFPFSAKGEYTSVQQSDYRIGRQTDWEIQLEADQVMTMLQITSNADDADWLITSNSSDGKAIAENAANMLELEASLDGRELVGKARMNLGEYRALTKLPCSGNADLTAVAANGVAKEAPQVEEDWIEFTVTGTALQPIVTLASNLPTDFISTITSGIKERLEIQRVDSEAKLKVAIDSKIEAITKQLDLVAKNGLQTLTQQRETLADMQHDLEQTLQSRDGIEYARAPVKSNTSR